MWRGVATVGLVLVATTSGCGDSDSTGPAVVPSTTTAMTDESVPPVETSLAPSLAGGVDGPVMFVPGPPTEGGEDALIEGVLVRDGDCLFVGDGAPGTRFAALWPFGTAWDEVAQEVVTASGTRIPVGSTFSAGGGYGSPEMLHHLLDGDVLKARANACAEGEFRELAHVQHSISATTMPSSPPPPTSSPPTPVDSGTSVGLVGPVWWLTQITVDGTPLELPPEGLHGSYLQFVDDLPCDECPEGPFLVGEDLCNSFSRSVEIDAGIVIVGAWGEATEAACDGNPGHEAISDVIRSDTFAYRFVDGELHLTAPSGATELTLETDTAPLGPSGPDTVAEGRVGDGAFRVAWTNGGLRLEWRDLTNDVFWRSTAGVGVNPDATMNAHRVDVGGEQILLGVVAAESERAQYVPLGGEPVELSLIDVTNPASRIIAEAVADSTDQWTIVVYDSEGDEIDRFER
jgi:hypothetical protein